MRVDDVISKYSACVRTKKNEHLFFNLLTLRHNFISKKSIAAIREVSASAAALNADVFPFLVVQSPEYLWFDAMDSIASAIRCWICCTLKMNPNA